MKRAAAFAWEFRFYVREGGQRKLDLYRSESDVRKAVENQVLQLNRDTDYGLSVGVTFGALLDRYLAEELPPRKSTADAYRSLIRNHLRPKWGKHLLLEIRPSELHSWFQSIGLAPISKGHLRSVMHKLFDLAALWEYLPLERRNPISIIKIKGVTKRQKEPTILTPDQFRDLIRRLPAHIHMMGITMALPWPARERNARFEVGRL